MIKLDVWLYGALSRHVPQEGRVGHSELHLEVPEGTRMRDVLERIGLPIDEKGITFVNGQLTDLPGVGADLDLEMHDGDRVGLFDERSMWPFQYRFGASTNPALMAAMQQRGFLRHSSR